MKKVLFSAYSLDVGGIETALVALIKELAKREEYEVTLILEKKHGIFLNEIPQSVKIVEYTPFESNNVLIRKVKNLIKQLKFRVKYQNKFDTSVSFATYSKAGSFIARVASKNAILWGHANYLTLFNGDKSKLKSFFKFIKYNKFKKIVFVSHDGKKAFEDNIKINKSQEIIECNNLIDYKNIILKSQEEIGMEKDNIVTFLNVGRHDERQKRLSRIIHVAKKMKEKGINFRILFVGEGKDTEQYKEMTKKFNLEENIIFLGKKKNPYPYFSICDAVILTSDYEGYPVVFLESMVLNKPIITTKVSDYEQVENKYGIITEKSEDDILNKMEDFIKNGFEIKERFNPENYNKKIVEKIIKILE